MKVCGDLSRREEVSGRLIEGSDPVLIMTQWKTLPLIFHLSWPKTTGRKIEQHRCVKKKTRPTLVVLPEEVEEQACERRRLTWTNNLQILPDLAFYLDKYWNKYWTKTANVEGYILHGRISLDFIPISRNMRVLAFVAPRMMFIDAYWTPKYFIWCPFCQ